MVQFKDLLSDSSSRSVSLLQMSPGNILLGPMPNVDHEKFYIIAGVNVDKICVCSVIINSEINQFILKRPSLLARQMELSPEKYSFLSHRSYVNCAQPIKGTFEYFQAPSFKLVGVLNKEDLMMVRQEIIKSGMLTDEEINIFFT